MTPAADDLRHARTLWDYLRLGVPARPADCLLVFGGSRAVPDGSQFRTEADAIADVLLRRGIPKDAIALERLASNTSENFWLSAELLRDLAITPQAFLIVTKPYAATGLIDPGEPVPAGILSAARALQEAGFNSRSLK